MSLSQSTIGFSPEFTRAARILRRNRLEAVELAIAVDRLRAFLLEPLQALARRDGFAREWPPGGPWRH